MYHQKHKIFPNWHFKIYPRPPTPYSKTPGQASSPFLNSPHHFESFLSFFTFVITKYLPPIDVILHRDLPSEGAPESHVQKVLRLLGAMGKDVLCALIPLFLLPNRHTDKVLNIGPGTWNSKLHAPPSTKIMPLTASGQRDRSRLPQASIQSLETSKIHNHRSNEGSSIARHATEHTASSTWRSWRTIWGSCSWERNWGRWGLAFKVKYTSSESTWQSYVVSICESWLC